MNPSLRVPKVQIQAEVVVEGRRPAHYKMFLSERLPHTHCERPSEMLNGSRSFLPVVDGSGGIVFLPIGVIVTVTIPATWEFESHGNPIMVPPGAELMSAQVSVELLDQTQVSGEVHYLSMGHNRRIQDHLNLDGRFVTLKCDDTAVLINKRHVARIVPAR